MIKALIIEDNLDKLRQIDAFLREVCNIESENILYAENIKSGRQKLMQYQFDLLLLDLVLPVNEDDSPSPEAGTAFLDEIHYNPNINTPIHIIGLTEFDEIFKSNQEQFEDKLWGLINFRISDNDWQDKLKTKVFYLQNFKKKYQTFIEEKNKYDIAIVVALNKEFEQLQRTSQWEKLEIVNDPLIYYTTTINTKNNNIKKVIACCINHMGMHSSAAVSAKIISAFSPSLIFITGICGGIQEAGVNLGDIVVATQCWDYEAGKISEDVNGNFIFKPDMLCLTTGQSIITKFTNFTNNKNHISSVYNSYSGDGKPSTQLNVFYGPIGSGPYVLSSKKYLAELISSDRKLIAIDMEGYGVYKSAQFYNDVTPVFVKSICDFGDQTKHDDHQNFSAYVSAKIVVDFIYDSL